MRGGIGPAGVVDGLHDAAVQSTRMLQWFAVSLTLKDVATRGGAPLLEAATFDALGLRMHLCGEVGS